MKDIIVVALVVVAFAWVFTVHIAITFGLAKKIPRWHALVGFFVAPLAPYWAWRENMHKRVWLWIAGVAVYIGAVVLASF